MNKKFTPAICKQLCYYVYLYTDPRNDSVFYVGKGKANRAFSHLDEQSEHEKVKYIKAIRDDGMEPKIEFLVHGLDEDTARRVEASVIDIYGKENLTNRVGGYLSRTHGRMSLEQLRATYMQDEVTVNVPAMLIRISKGYRHNMSPIEIYDTTRHAWPVGKRAHEVKYAFAVYDGIVREVYEISAWLDAGSTFLTSNPSGRARNDKRKEFIGKVADESIRKQYIYKSVAHYFKKGQQFPFTYVGLPD